MPTDAATLGLSLSPERMGDASAGDVGFRFGDRGTHTSRTLMFEELTTLLDAAGPGTSRAAYRDLIIDDNCLGKRSAANRRISNTRLGELYGLDEGVLLFRILRHLWQSEQRQRRLLALLVPLARDPLLRITAEPVLKLDSGQELTRQSLTDVLTEATGSRFRQTVLDKVARNAASSWTQSGHLEGRVRKRRRLVSPTPVVVTAALAIGYLLGARGERLFQTLWARVLDTPGDELMNMAADAKRLGMMEMNQAGGIVEVSFPRLLGRNGKG